MLELNKDKFKIIGCDDADADVITRPNITYWQDAWRRLKKNRLAMVSMFVLIFMILLVIIGPYLNPNGGLNIIDTSIINGYPNSKYWFGNDQLGRDLFTRVWLGGRVSITIGVVATFVQIVVGSLYGGIMGYFGGLTDDIMMRIVEILNSIPYLIVVILISVVMGSGIGSLLLALCLTAWTGTARQIRGMVLQLRESEYVLASQALGADPGRIITKHLIPNTIGILIIQVSFAIPAYIFEEAFLSFIGLGIQPPDTSWGALISYGQSTFEFYPHQLWFPAGALFITMLVFNLLGDGLRDALDPRLRQ
ncbi:MAG: oligopeptide/dipeptide transporter, permease protein [Clostridiales bacterium]|jgi:oligopeptide transport system permease protein|nr:oligopeptide/dipeptide transporter, permease protein [Clostridiales bacterium]